MPWLVKRKYETELIEHTTAINNFSFGIFSNIFDPVMSSRLLAEDISTLYTKSAVQLDINVAFPSYIKGPRPSADLKRLHK